MKELTDIVAMAGAKNICTIFTLDKDFEVYKIGQKKHLDFLPKKLK